MEYCQLSYKRSTIGYYRFGKGPSPAICFHGYGEDGTSFAFLEKYASDQFSFIAIDLPFHGKTEWNEGLNFPNSDLLQIIKEILEKEYLKLNTQNLKLTLLGFSLGGRIALSLYQELSNKTERMMLMAPDGLKINFWYWLSTQTGLGNRLFRYTMKHPGWFFGFLKLLNKLGMVNASIFKFVNYYIGDRDVRRLLYERWTCLRKLKPHIKRIKLFIRNNKTKTRLIYGKHDRIITTARGNKFTKGIEELCTVTIIQSGHQVLHEKHVAELLPLFRD